MHDPRLDSVCGETGEWPLDIDDLLRFSYQVAQGLDFLAEKNVSHKMGRFDCMFQKHYRHWERITEKK